MTQIRHRLWTLAREPRRSIGLVSRSPSAEAFDAAGFKSILSVDKFRHCR